MGAAARPSPGGGGAASLRLGRDLVLAGRTERFAGASSSAQSIGGGRVSSQWQWQLVVRRDASLAFAAFPLSSASSSSSSSSGGHAHLAPAPSVAASRPGAVPLGSWVHLAVTVDASGAARESAARLKSGGPAATTTPDATVRLFVDGEQLEEGPVRTAPPLPLLDPLPPGQALPAAQAGSPAAAAVAAGTLAAAAGTSDQLLIGPDFVGRLAEVRLLSGVNPSLACDSRFPSPCSGAPLGQAAQRRGDPRRARVPPRPGRVKADAHAGAFDNGGEGMPLSSHAACLSADLHQAGDSPSRCRRPPGPTRTGVCSGGLLSCPPIGTWCGGSEAPRGPHSRSGPRAAAACCLEETGRGICCCRRLPTTRRGRGCRG